MDQQERQRLLQEADTWQQQCFQKQADHGTDRDHEINQQILLLDPGTQQPCQVELEVSRAREQHYLQLWNTAEWQRQLEDSPEDSP
jgi:hypothetical protein